MKKVNKYNYVVLIIAWLCCLKQGQAQVFPGDANNDGIINNLDILYIGYAYGTIGPMRSSIDGTTPEAITLPWTQLFPDSTNFIHADTDGNGIVDFLDFVPVFNNYGLRRINPSPPFFSEGIPGIDPSLRFGSPVGTAFPSEGSVVEIPILLEGTFGDSLVDLNGIAFSIEYDQSFIKEIQLDIADSWVALDSAAFLFQTPANIGRLDAALTRFGKNPVIGKGQAVKMRAVIEDDLIGLLIRDTAHIHFNIKYIKLKNSDFREQPVAGSNITLVIYHPNSIVPIKERPTDIPIEIFPNPASDRLQIISPKIIQRIEIMNALGQYISYPNIKNEQRVELMLPPQLKGIAFVKIYTTAGFITRKILIE
ncbi:MAG: T9SS type A sorting domain-containing protein [Saprospiraceae bacterium]|nr:T9SS type A sorting domain-containing protein [Saprospiraceae bacterium]